MKIVKLKNEEISDQFHITQKTYTNVAGSKVMTRSKHDTVLFIHQGTANLISKPQDNEIESTYTENSAIYIPKNTEYHITSANDTALKTIEICSDSEELTHSPTLFKPTKPILAKHFSQGAKFTTDPGEIIYELIGRFSENSKKIGLAYVILPKGGNKQTELHRHSITGEKEDCDNLAYEECYFLLQGTGIMQIDDEKETLIAGDLVYIPPGKMHQLSNLSETEDCVFLAISCPAWKPECMIYEALSPTHQQNSCKCKT